MAIITEVRFAHEDGALADTLTALPDLGVTVVGEASTDPDKSRYYIRFDGPDAATALDADHTVSDAVRMHGSVPDPGPRDGIGDANGDGADRTQLWGIAFAPGTALLAPRVTEAGGFVLDARSASSGTPRGWHERWLLPDREALQTIWQHASGTGFDFEVVELHRRGRTDAEYPGPDALTAEQREALVAAYEQGYFAEPRETSLEELADSFDLSASAVGGRINRGLKALIGAALVRDERG
jgi:hypothetical protein